MFIDKNIIDIYKNLYNLPELTYKEKVNFDFFRLCRPEYNFVIISIYNEKRELLLLRDLNKNIGWELVGGYIEKNEKIEDAVNRIVLKETGLAIDELQPIVILNNNFEWNNRVISHYGIAFAALARGQVKPQPRNIKVIYTKETPETIVYQNKKIFQKVKQIIKNKPFEPPYQEIESSRKFFFPYVINKYLVKNIGRSASKKIKKQILNLIFNSPKSIIDVCCGDDNFIFELEKLYNPELCVANDISWKILSLLGKKRKKSKVIMTNHNVVDLSFDKKFDLVIFKNTLHHIPKTEQINIIKKLSNLSKQLIIVDVENPNKSNFLSKVWHWYYAYFLGDQGEYFLTFKEFKEILKGSVEDKNFSFGIIKTIKGNYFYASLTDIIQGEEVEIKARIDSGRVKEIRKRLFDSGAVFKEKIKESDSYFTAPHRDFIKTKECLRVREGDGYLELTYKGPTTEAMREKKQFWKSEINIPLNCSKKETELLFKALDFRKVAEVKKEREKYIINKQTVTLDNIEGLGYFLEIERTIDGEKERKEALKENIKLIEKIGLDEEDIVTKPYRDLVRENLEKKIDIKG